MFEAKLTGEASVINALASIAAKTSPELEKTVTRLAIRVLRSVKTKLSGDVLSVKTGRLRRSINYKVESSTAGVGATVGTNVEYAAGHEFGFKGVVNVKAHTRAISEAFGKKLTTPVNAFVRGHSARRNMPERSFLRSALTELQPEIITEIEATIAKIIREQR